MLCTQPGYPNLCRSNTRHTQKLKLCRQDIRFHLSIKGHSHSVIPLTCRLITYFWATPTTFGCWRPVLLPKARRWFLQIIPPIHCSTWDHVSSTINADIIQAFMHHITNQKTTHGMTNLFWELEIRPLWEPDSVLAQSGTSVSAGREMGAHGKRQVSASCCPFWDYFSFFIGRPKRGSSIYLASPNKRQSTYKSTLAFLSQGKPLQLDGF